MAAFGRQLVKTAGTVQRATEGWKKIEQKAAKLAKVD